MFKTYLNIFSYVFSICVSNSILTIFMAVMQFAVMEEIKLVDFFSDVSGLCSSCPLGCVECGGCNQEVCSDRLQCQECAEGFYLSEQDGLCRELCQEGFYQNLEGRYS